MRSNRDKLVRVMRTLNHIDEQYHRIRRTLHMRGSLFVLLYACADGEPRSQKEISDEWHIPRSTLNTVIKEQVSAGNVLLVPRGNRQKDIILTESGQALAEQLIGRLFDVEESVANDCVTESLPVELEHFADGLEGAFDQLLSKDS